MTEKQDQPDSGDRIQMGDVGEHAAVAAGRGAKALSIGTLQIDARLWPVVVVLVIVIAVMGYFLWPRRPDRMTGEFNVAVAEFQVVDQAGNRVRSPDGKEFADFLSQRLDAELSGLNLGVSHELWPPDYTGSVKGATPAERASDAERVAGEINANLLVYGVITEAGERSQLTPEFYVDYRGFATADELIGQHELGRPVRVDLPFDPNQFQGVDNPALNARLRALNLITVGLAYYSTDALENALVFFEQAEATEGWLSSAGKEVAYLLLGNTVGRMAGNRPDPSLLPAALNYYENALSINPDYARALVGQANIIYLLALGDPADPSFDLLDVSALDEAESLFQRALQMEAPQSANIPVKAHLGLGLIDLARAQILEGDWIEQARAQFEQVVVEYESGNQRIQEYAGHAYARLGLIDLINGDTNGAIDRYTTATQLVSPYWKGYYFTRIGEILASSGERARAVEAYEEAIQVAEQYGDQKNAETYLSRLREIQRGE